MAKHYPKEEASSAKKILDNLQWPYYDDATVVGHEAKELNQDIILTDSLCLIRKFSSLCDQSYHSMAMIVRFIKEDEFRKMLANIASIESLISTNIANELNKFVAEVKKLFGKSFQSKPSGLPVIHSHVNQLMKRLEQLQAKTCRLTETITLIDCDLLQYADKFELFIYVPERRASYFSLMTDISNALVSLSTVEMPKILIKPLESVPNLGETLIPNIHCKMREAISFHRWSLAVDTTDSANVTMRAILIDCCTQIEYFKPPLLSEKWRRVIDTICKMKSCIPTDCETEVHKLRNINQDISYPEVLNIIECLKNKVLSGTNIGMYLCQSLPKFYIDYIVLLGNLKIMISHLQKSCGFVDTELKQLVQLTTECCHTVISSLRVNFFQAKNQYVSNILSNPISNSNCNIVELGDNCKETLRRIALIIPQADFTSKNVTKENKKLVSDCIADCSKVTDELLKIGHTSILQNSLLDFLGAFIDILHVYVDDVYNKRFEDCCKKLIEALNVVQKGVFVNSQQPQVDDAQQYRTDCFEIYFYVVVQYSVWQLEDDCVVGLKSYDCTPAKPTRVSSFRVVVKKDDYIVMRSKLTFSLKDMGKKFYYKYFVLSTDFDSMELLYTDSPTKEEAYGCYRVRILPSGEIASPESVYDSCLYPQVPLTLAEKVWGVITFNNQGNLGEPNRTREKDICVEAYLGEDFKNIKDDMSSESAAITLYENTLAVFDSLEKAKKMIPGQERSSIAVLQKEGSSLAQIIFADFLNAIHEGPHQILFNLIAFGILKILQPKLTEKSMKTMLSSINVVYDENTKKCLQFEILKENRIFLQKRKPFIDGIFYLIKNLCSKFPLFPWILMMRALPIYHWLSEDPPVEPFTELDETPHQVMNVINEQAELLSGFKLKENDLKDVVLMLSPLELQGDFKLQAVLLSACPEKHYLLLLDCISLPFILMGVEQNLQEMKLSEKAEAKEIERLFSQISWSNQPIVIRSFITSIIHSLKFNINNIPVKCLSSFVLAIAKCLFALSENMPSSDKIEFLDPLIAVADQMAYIVLKSNQHGGMVLKECEKEHTFWLDLLKHGHECDEWKHGLSELIKSRAKKVDTFGNKVDVYIALCQKHGENDTIVQLVFDVIEPQIPSAKPQELKKLAGHSSKRSNTFLSQLLERRYQSPLDITFEDVLEYELWPTILTAYVVSKGKGFSEHSTSLCLKLHEVLQSTESDIMSGNITVGQLRQFESKWDNHTHPIMTTLKLNGDSFKNSLNKMSDHVCLFNFYLALMKNFIHQLDMKEFEACQSMHVKFQQLRDVQSIKICDLCTEFNQHSWQYPVFDDAANFTEMLLNFAVLTYEEFKNDIFHFKWQELTQLLDTSVSFSDLYTALWVPLFQYCASLPKQLESRDISLFEADRLFNGSYVISDSISHLVNAVYYSNAPIEFLKLAKMFASQESKSLNVSSLVVEEARKYSRNISTEWTKSVAKSIALWCNLDPVFNEAKEFSSVLSTYGIDNYGVVCFYEMDIHTVQLKSVLQDQQILLQFLKKYRDIPKDVKESIKLLGECSELRQWILSKSEDLNAIETFIGVLLDTMAGEGDQIQDRLTSLSELCGKFYSLIYQLPKSAAEFDVITKIFEETGENLKSSHRPVSLVVSLGKPFSGKRLEI